MSEEKSAPKDNRLAKPGETVELVVGEQWVDDLSGISLFRGFYRLASQHEMKASKMAKEFGYVREKEKQPIAVLPKGKDLSRVEKAIRLGILKIYDSDNPTVYRERAPANHRRVNDAEVDAGSRYTDEFDAKIEHMLKMKVTDFSRMLRDYKSLQMLDQIYEAECEGRNPTAGPRKPYIDAIRSRMADKDVGGVGKVSSDPKDNEVVKVR